MLIYYSEIIKVAIRGVGYKFLHFSFSSHINILTECFMVIHRQVKKDTDIAVRTYHIKKLKALDYEEKGSQKFL